MKKYKKPVLDIVEFDNMDVIVMSNGSSTSDVESIAPDSGKIAEDNSSTGSEDSNTSSTGGEDSGNPLTETGDSDTSSTGTEDSSSDDNSVYESGIE